MPKTGEPSGALPPSSDHVGSPVFKLAGTVLTPSPQVASRWNGALGSRLNRAPLELFLRRHSQSIPRDCRDPVTEGIELATMFMIHPVIPHPVHWGALVYAGYFDALGLTIAGIARAIGNIVHEPRLWRVAALRSMGRLLTPVMGIDMAASVTAAAVAKTGFTPHRPGVLDGTLDQLAATALSGASEHALVELRSFVGERLLAIAERGAANMMAAPTMVTISAEPPSNH